MQKESSIKRLFSMWFKHN